MFTFSVKSYKLTALAILSMLLLYRPLHCVRTNQASSSSRPAESSNSRVEPVKEPEQVKEPEKVKEPVQASSASSSSSKKEVKISELLSQYEKKVYRDVDPKLLGIYFFKENRDLCDLKDSVDRFEKSESVKELVNFLNQVLSTQIQQCKFVDRQTGQSYVDYKRRDRLFHKFMSTIAEEMRPTAMLTEPDRGLFDKNQWGGPKKWDYIFSCKIPLIKEKLGDTSYISLDLSGDSKTSWLERACKSLDSKPIPQVMTPEYLITVIPFLETAYQRIAVLNRLKDSDEVTNLTKRLNQIAEYNTQIYNSHTQIYNPQIELVCYKRADYKRDYRRLLSCIIYFVPVARSFTLNAPKTQMYLSNIRDLHRAIDQICDSHPERKPSLNRICIKIQEKLAMLQI